MHLQCKKNNNDFIPDLGKLVDTVTTLMCKRAKE